ncbi:MAG TPA: hypothetical protein VJ904_07805, partial [Tichowtungia sp.]|nr:hypothetical protein [Tichowtungia sp.]
SSFSPGDLIKLDYKINDTWIADKGVIYWGADAFQLGFIRTIEAVSGNQITLVEPLVEAIQMKYGGAVIQKRNDDNVFKNVGFEALRLVSTYAADDDDNHGWTAIRMQKLHNGWVRQVTSQYFAYSLVTFDDSRQATVEDCAFIEPKSLIAGGHRYSFGLDDTQQILFQRCLANEGRHDFVSGSKSPGPNAWVDCSTVDSIADSGPHLKYATGQIYDNVKAKQFTVHQTGGTHGWTGAQILFWNSQAADTVPGDIESGGFITCDAAVGAMNWVIGSVGVEYHRKTVQDRGIWDSHNTPVRLRSLYYAQLEERLGMSAVNNIILPQQKVGRIWDDLESWFGDGLFGDDLLVWADGGTVVSTNQPLAVRGIVRNLQMLDRGVTAAWSKVSGPGSVNFADATALETTATFSQPGEYVLQLVVDDGVSAASNAVEVAVDDGGPDTTPPAQLIELSAVADQSLVDLDWYNSWETDVTGYNVYRRTESGSYGGPLVTNLTSSDYTDTQVTNGITYTYVVTAIDSSGNESDPSAEVSALPELDLTPPAVPGDLYVASGNAYVLLNWADNTEEDLAGYSIYRRTASGSFGSALVSGLDVSEYIDTTVENGTAYYYAVTAVDVHDNESVKSAEGFAAPEEFGGTTRIDFGTDPGRQTYSEAGFSFNTESVNSTVANLATAVQINSPDRNWTTLSRTFAGLGAGRIDDFTISMVLTVDAWNT